MGVSTTTTAQPEDARPHTADCSGRGRRPVAAYPKPAQQVKSLVIAAGQWPQRAQAHVLALRGPADPARRT